ncbi:hypothetical protein PUV47_18850 [Pseudovibrio exalbescens]|uniref:hypothetical protein n=1 Tax=Pseudovibrio exalbescens TaxID=197461 RepID=UPI0023668987|nr:hypothetical protein [Pseudovibrio exalbescens]MDD7911996.1 hypothetical protein [Pseudovibrio exalbescens]
MLTTTAISMAVLSPATAIEQVDHPWFDSSHIGIRIDAPVLPQVNRSGTRLLVFSNADPIDDWVFAEEPSWASGLLPFRIQIFFTEAYSNKNLIIGNTGNSSWSSLLGRPTRLSRVDPNSSSTWTLTEYDSLSTSAEDLIIGQVSADDMALTGSMQFNSGEGYTAVYWSTNDLADQGQMIDIGGLFSSGSPLASSYGRAISSDGLTVVGDSAPDISQLSSMAPTLFPYEWQPYTLAGSQAFVWSAGTMSALDNLSAGAGAESSAQAVNSDGTVIVGLASNDSNELRAVRWDGTGITDLGTLRADQSGQSLARAVSADGQHIVGAAQADDGAFKATVWNYGVATNLGTLKADNSGTSYATSISEDGKTIVGLSDTDNGFGPDSSGEIDASIRPFIYRNSLQDTYNVAASMQDVATDMGLATNRMAEVTRWMARSGALPAQAGKRQIGIGTYGLLDDGSRSNSFMASASMRLSERFGFGGAVGVSSRGGIGDTVSADLGYSLAAFASYRPAMGENWTWDVRASGAYSALDGTISRGDGYANVQATKADASFNSVYVGLDTRLTYQALDRLTISPHASLGLAHHHRGAYDESMELDTSAHYDALDLTEFYGGLGVEVAHQLTDSVRLRIDTGFDVDLASDDHTLTGTTTLPGFETVDIDFSGDRNALRGYLETGLSYAVTQAGSLDLSARMFTPHYQESGKNNVDFAYSVRLNMEF